MNISKLNNFILDLLFPKFCFGCHKEGEYLCQDCSATLEINDSHLSFKGKNLDDLYFSIEYKNFLSKKLILAFKYFPLVKSLGKEISKIIISHFLFLEKKPDFSDFLLIPVPLSKRKLKWRGFNQSEEIGREIAKFFEIPLVLDCLFKKKETEDQVNLNEKERRENLKGVFLVKRREKIFGRKILLIDDVFTTGSTMEECAKVLKEAGVKKVVGIVLARAEPGGDRPHLI